MADPRENVDDLFQEAVALIHSGDVASLGQLLASHPNLAVSRLESPGPWLRDKIGAALDSFFQRPYLLWFVSEDAVLYGTLPANISEVANIIIRAAKATGGSNLQEQLDYALSLVAWSSVAANCSVQIQLLDELVDAGADPNGGPDKALVNHHFAAAKHLVARGARLTLASAFCLGQWDEATRLNAAATDRERRFAFVLAALNGQSEALRQMIDLAYLVNAHSEDLYSHGTPLHHAVCSGSLGSVQTLVDAGAGLDERDTAWQGTPLGWAEHYVAEATDDQQRESRCRVAEYLRARAAQRGE